jgi:hypothetical protein
VRGEEVAQWRPQGDTVEIDLRRPKTGEVDLVLDLNGPAVTETTSPVVRVPDAWRSRGIARVQVESGGLLTLADPASGRPPTTEELAGYPGPQSRDPSQGIPLVVTEPTRPPRWNLAWAEATEMLAVQVDRLMAEVLLSEGGRAYYRLGLAVRSNGVADLALIPPPGFRLTEAWNHDAPLAPARRGEAVVLPLEATGAGDEGEEQLLVMEGYLPLSLPADGRLSIPLPQASAPIGRVSVRVLLPGEWRAALAEGGRSGRAIEPAGYESLDRPPGFRTLEASWSALSPNPAPLSLEIDHDPTREEWF